MLVPAIPHPTNKTLPTGGVQSPIQRFKTKMMPKWTGSTPILIATGRKIGVKISTAGVMSMNVPIISKKRLIMRRTITGEAERDMRAELIPWGIFS